MIRYHYSGMRSWSQFADFVIISYCEHVAAAREHASFESLYSEAASSDIVQATAQDFERR